MINHWLKLWNQKLNHHKENYRSRNWSLVKDVILAFQFDLEENLAAYLMPSSFFLPARVDACTEPIKFAENNKSQMKNIIQIQA